MSVNDYGIVSGNIMDSVENFFVLPQSFYSDHSEIVLSICNKNIPNVLLSNTGTWFPLEKRKKWSAENLSKLNQKLEEVPTDICKIIKDKISNNDIDGASKCLLDRVDCDLPLTNRNTVNPLKKIFHKNTSTKGRRKFQSLRLIENYKKNLK